MSLKSIHDSKETYPYDRAGTLVSIRITDILTKTVVFVPRQRFRIRKRHIMT